jgi:hypothetical protein
MEWKTEKVEPVVSREESEAVIGNCRIVVFRDQKGDFIGHATCANYSVTRRDDGTYPRQIEDAQREALHNARDMLAKNLAALDAEIAKDLPTEITPDA